MPPTRSARGYPKPFASRVAGAGPPGWATSLAGPLSRDRERCDDVDPGQPSEPGIRLSWPRRSLLRRDRPDVLRLDFWRPLSCLGEAGSIAVHHERTVHVSATNFPGTERRLLLFQYRAADAWPPLSFAGGVEKFDDLLLGGSPTLIRRLSPVPVRLLLPSAEYQGSICENQQFTCRRFFETAAEPEHLTAAE